MNKPQFTEIEIKEMCDLYADNYYYFAVSDIMQFLEKLGYSKVSNTMTELRKEFVNKRCREKHEQRRLRYPNSELQSKLLKRIDFMEFENKII